MDELSGYGRIEKWDSDSYLVDKGVMSPRRESLLQRTRATGVLLHCIIIV
jgi:hypothetical protein